MVKAGSLVIGASAFNQEKSHCQCGEQLKQLNCDT
jgi:hypothetical protein